MEFPARFEHPLCTTDDWGKETIIVKKKILRSVYIIDKSVRPLAHMHESVLVFSTYTLAIL